MCDYVHVCVCMCVTACVYMCVRVWYARATGHALLFLWMGVEKRAPVSRNETTRFVD